ncbi:hypothetical protein AALP_AA1G331400 [Arabis alpina]|uniref:Uncharacterized protein n=1 Tax=Arabis alpina TaxID=50452 RepID=A0A087HSA0_ARAAL|nr:hypothetical protein AALP_AA1G331400 [Arabis alpina]
MSSAQMDPHDKMRSRGISKVARGEQAPRPAHTPGTVSPPPENKPKFRAKRGENNGDGGGGGGRERDSTANETRHCFNRYMQYNKCIEKKGSDANDCNNLRDYVRSLCPEELVEKWEEQRRLGTLPSRFEDFIEKGVSD